MVREGFPTSGGDTFSSKDEVFSAPAIRYRAEMSIEVFRGALGAAVVIMKL